MIKVQIDKESLKQLYIEAAHMEEAIPRHLRTAINKTSKTIRVQIAKRLGKVITLKNNFPPPELKKAQTLKKVIKAKSMASTEKLEARIGFTEGYPFPLKYFDARPYIRTIKGEKRNAGVKYKLNNFFLRKATDLFMVPKFNNHVYRREGNNPLPIRKVKGPAPGYFYDMIQALPTAKKIAEERLPIEMKRRIREIMLERKGIINLKASRGTGT